MPRQYRRAQPDGDAAAIGIARIIARLNIGGPAIQAITLTRRLEERGYRTRLIRGRESEREGSMDDLAGALEVRPTLVGSLRRDPGWRDLVALLHLVWLLRRDRPAVVHTHAAKAGTLGRVATLIAFPLRRPILIHTFHGHSLTGYFSSRTARFYRAVERWLARRTDVLVAVSAEVRDELVAMGVADSSSFVVIPLGFDLSPFLDDADRLRRRAAVRQEWGVGEEERVVTLIARLVPIKRVDRFLRLAVALAGTPGVRFLVVGDGELRDELASSPEARQLGERLMWTGFRRDVADVCVASDVVVLTSDNEGTPVSLIEAQAAAVPVVATDAGGVRSVVQHERTGLLADPEDEMGLAEGVARILAQPALAARMAAAGRAHVAAAFTLERLVEDHDALYRRLLSSRP